MTSDTSSGLIFDLLRASVMVIAPNSWALSEESEPFRAPDYERNEKVKEKLFH